MDDIKKIDETERKALICEYQQRNVRWNDNRIRQLSYFNNLILTLNVGFISFSYKELITNDLELTCRDLNWQFTFMALSVIVMFLDAVLGLVISLNRLLDFRLTHRILQIRQNMFEHSSFKMSEETPSNYTWAKRMKLIWNILKENYPKIPIETCKSFKNKPHEEKEIILQDFNELRDIVHNLGINTWKNTIWQVLLFGASLLFYFLAIIFN